MNNNNNIELIYLLQEVPHVGKVKANEICVEILTKNPSKDFLLEYFARLNMYEGDTSFLEREVCNRFKQLNNQYNVLTVLDDDYPSKLESLGKSRPTIIYAKGNMNLLSKPGIAIIGTRKPSLKIKPLIEDIVKSCAETGKVIVSGLAMGCDAIAHECALEYGADTIAVLPSGFNKITPKSNESLANMIVASGGLLISEYDTETNCKNYMYAERDKIIAALSDKLIVMQCQIKSGSMLTVREAFRQQKSIGTIWDSFMEETDDFNGNREVLKSYEGTNVIRQEALREFLDRKVIMQREEQLNFLKG